ncbi:MAG: hypothetical protein AB7T06_15160 [Kofleriaceae bacterium]
MGKSLLLVMMCVACANNVSEKARTGADGTIKGAREVVLEEGVGKQRDIVTYPGGDRIDWKKVVLPEKAKGTLDLKMKYTTPRPDLKASFDVFDEWYHPVKATRAGRGRNRSMTIDKAKGTYYVRVYAPRRMDAATYVLEASFAPEVTTGLELDKIPIPDPPRLPQVPEPDPECVVAYDKMNNACADKCPPGSPKNHKGCVKPGDATPTPPVVTPPPVVEPPPSKPVIARIVNKEVQGDGTIIVTLGAGSEHGIGKEWTKGSLLRGDTKDPKARFPNGSVTVIQVGKRTTKVKLRQGITSDVLRDNDKVVLEP